MLCCFVYSSNQVNAILHSLVHFCTIYTFVRGVGLGAGLGVVLCTTSYNFHLKIHNFHKLDKFERISHLVKYVWIAVRSGWTPLMSAH